MKLSQMILRALLAFLAICVVQMLVGMLVPIKAPTVPHLFAWLLLINALSAVVLSIVAVRSEWRGWKLGTALAVIPFTISSLNQLEGTVFLKNSHLPWDRLFVNSLLSTVLMIPIWMLLFGRRPSEGHDHYHPIQSKGRGERAWKFALSDVSYLVLYYTAGMIIFPYVRDFYATQQLPSPGTIIALQLLIRGPVFVLLCIGLARMLGLPRLTGALAVGLIFTLLSGVAPLLIPNPYFPDSVRWVHFCEVVSENFIFGAIVAWLWGAPMAMEQHAMPQAA